jgi:hypothetical protein
MSDEHRPGDRVPKANPPRQPQGRAPRAVIAPDGQRFESVSAAVKHLRQWPGTVHQKCTRQHGGWHFADEALERVPTPGSKG